MDFQKANSFIDNYAKESILKHNKEDRVMEKNFRISTNKTLTSSIEEDKQPLTIEELITAIGKMKYRKGSDPDNIHPEKNIMLGEKTCNALLNIFNHSWGKGWTPKVGNRLISCLLYTSPSPRD